MRINQVSITPETKYNIQCQHHVKMETASEIQRLSVVAVAAESHAVCLSVLRPEVLGVFL